jgi:hypothetical protein
MSRLILFIYLYDDENNPVEELMKHIDKQEKQALFSHAGVVRLALNTFAFEETTAHGRLAILCAEAQRRDRAYLLVPVDPNSALLAGKPSKDIQDILERFGVPSRPPLIESS